MRLVAVCGAETTPVLCSHLATSAPVSARFFFFFPPRSRRQTCSLCEGLLRAADTLSLALNNMLF